MRELLTWGAVAVGGYLLYEYFYGTAATTAVSVTRGAVDTQSYRPTTTPVTSENTSGSVGMSVRNNVAVLTPTQMVTMGSRSRSPISMKGLGVIAGRGSLLYGFNSTSRDNLNSGVRPITAYKNKGEHLSVG